MCFSATASFAASAMLVGAGTISLRLAREPRQRAFAAMPLIFAVQQLIEGLLWLSLEHPDREALVAPLSVAYLFFAQLLWPVWVPAALRAMERNAQRRRLLGWITAIGVLVAVYHGWALVVGNAQASILGRHVHYSVAYPGGLHYAGSALYFLATVVSAFLSTGRHVWVLGLALVLTYLVARVAFTGYVISVWCYFAALISVVVIHVLLADRAQPKEQA